MFVDDNVLSNPLSGAARCRFFNALSIQRRAATASCFFSLSSPFASGSHRKGGGEDVDCEKERSIIFVIDAVLRRSGRLQGGDYVTLKRLKKRKTMIRIMDPPPQTPPPIMFSPPHENEPILQEEEVVATVEEER